MLNRSNTNATKIVKSKVINILKISYFISRSYQNKNKGIKILNSYFKKINKF